MLNFEIECFRSEVLTHSSCLIIGVDDDDSLVSLSDIDQRSFDVLLGLVGLDVDLGVGALQAAVGPVPADLLQRLDDGLVGWSPARRSSGRPAAPRRWWSRLLSHPHWWLQADLEDTCVKRGGIKVRRVY